MIDSCGITFRNLFKSYDIELLIDIKEPIKIGKSSYTLNQKIGSGGNAHIYEVWENNDSNRKFAMKIPLEKEELKAYQMLQKGINDPMEMLNYNTIPLLNHGTVRLKGTKHRAPIGIFPLCHADLCHIFRDPKSQINYKSPTGHDIFGVNVFEAIKLAHDIVSETLNTFMVL